MIFYKVFFALGDYKIDENKNNISINIDKESETVTTNKNGIIHINHLKKVAYKTSYCVHCGSCEAECPTGALSVFPKV